MTIEEAQKLVDNWIKKKGVRYFNELTNTTILMEEVGELARGEENLDLADEIADVLWVLMCIANQTGVDLTDALKKNIEKKDKRDSQRHLDNKKLR